MHKFWKNFEISDKGLFGGTVFRKSAAAKCNFLLSIGHILRFSGEKVFKGHACRKKGTKNSADQKGLL